MTVALTIDFQILILFNFNLEGKKRDTASRFEPNIFFATSNVVKNSKAKEIKNIISLNVMFVQLMT